MKPGWRITLIVLLQSVALIAMVGIKQYTLATGVPVVIKTKPIDPRSLFRGDYVRLNYSISVLSLAELAGDKHFVRGDTVYVVLHKQGEYWEALSVHHQMPKVASDQVVIKGEVKYAYGTGYTRQGQPTPAATTRINVKYGVENYFVPERQGRELERPKTGETISIRLVIDRFGNAAIRAVLVNGVPRYTEKLF